MRCHQAFLVCRDHERLEITEEAEPSVDCLAHRAGVLADPAREDEGIDAAHGDGHHRRMLCRFQHEIFEGEGGVRIVAAEQCLDVVTDAGQVPSGRNAHRGYPGRSRRRDQIVKHIEDGTGID